MICDAEVDLLISIVSHNQGDQVKKLLESIERHCSLPNIAVALTINIKEDLPFEVFDYSFPIYVINNVKPKGFGANHNKAFALMKNNYYCVLNPDVYFTEAPFTGLIDCIKLENAGVVGPIVFNSNGQLEDTARILPTPLKLLSRQFKKGNDYAVLDTYQNVDWVAGMLMLFKSVVFKQLNGFDERYYLYCEDIDLCSRIWLSGKKVIWNNSVSVFHDAQRSSHTILKYLFFHLASLTRLFCSPVYYRRLFQKHFLEKVETKI